MKIRLLLNLFLLAIALPFFFSCSTTKEYYSFGPATGKFHGKTAQNTKPDAAVNPSEKAATSAPAAAEMAVAASDDQQLTKAAETTSETVRADVAAGAKADKTAKAVAKNKTTKLNLVQKLALKKAQKILKNATENQFKTNTAQKPDLLSKLMLDQNLKMALIFLLVGLILYIIPGPVGWILGTICVVIALIFLILWVSTL